MRDNERRPFLIAGAASGIAALVAGLLGTRSRPVEAAEKFEVTLTEEEWRKILNPAQFDVLRREGTERPYSSPLNDEHRAGRFVCAGCNLDAFSSSTKFDSGTGWPSFWQPLDNAVGRHVDSTLGMKRTEVHCRRCGGHFGHVFDDGPKPTGLRYCMNGLSLRFNPGPA
jgi:peptide-methionine (R)-S-oxide reductase